MQGYELSTQAQATDTDTACLQGLVRTADRAASKLLKAVRAELAAVQALRRAASSAVDALSALVEAQQSRTEEGEEREAAPAPGVAAAALGGGWTGGVGEPPALQMRNPWAWGAEGSGGAAAAAMEVELRGMQADCLGAAREALLHRSLALELVQGVQRDIGLLSRECGEGLEAAARGLEGRAVAAHATSTGKLQEVGRRNPPRGGKPMLHACARVCCKCPY